MLRLDTRCKKSTRTGILQIDTQYKKSTRTGKKSKQKSHEVFHHQMLNISNMAKKIDFILIAI